MDRGVTWSSYSAADFWTAVKSGEQSVQDDGPEFVWPGVGGTFPGVYETGFLERGNGQMMGAFRFSGPPRAWHQSLGRRGESFPPNQTLMADCSAMWSWANLTMAGSLGITCDPFWLPMIRH